jgi:hypothetical protein
MFLSSQTVQDQFTAENATLNEDHHEDTKRKLCHLYNSLIFLFSFLYSSSQFYFERLLLSCCSLEESGLQFWSTQQNRTQHQKAWLLCQDPLPLHLAPNG